VSEELTLRPEDAVRLREEFYAGKRKDFWLEFRAEALYVVSEGQEWRVLPESEVAIISTSLAT